MADLSKELSKELNKDFAYCEDALGRAENAIGNLPSVQPEKRTEERTETHACDLIDRQAAIDICANAIDLWHGQIGEGALVAVRDKIAELTPAEPKEGRWIEISSIIHTYKCSVCGRLLVNVADGRNNVSKHYPYCHCGADMRGEQNG